MHGIAVNIVVLFIKGIPEGLLTVLALHVFTRTKTSLKKYLLICLIYIIATYLIRFLPITLGINSLLSYFVLILIFQITYKNKLSKVIYSIASAAAILILVAISEVLNMLLLAAMYGRDNAEAMFNSNNGLTKGLSSSPSNVFLAIFVFAGYLLFKKIDKRKLENGKNSDKTGA